MELWFDTGKVMEDGKKKRTVCAYSEITAEEYRSKGFKEVKKKSVSSKKVLLKKASASSASKEDEGEGR